MKSFVRFFSISCLLLPSACSEGVRRATDEAGDASEGINPTGEGGTDTDTGTGSDTGIGSDTDTGIGSDTDTGTETDGGTDDGPILDLPDPCLDHCSNATQDCGELAVDCGGECGSCEPALEITGRWLGMRGADGIWRVGITSGTFAFTPGLWDKLVASGKNLYNDNTAGAGAYGVTTSNAWVNGNFTQGLDEAFWAGLEQRVEAAAAQGIGVIVTPWSTVALEGDRGANCAGPNNTWTCRWDINPWNANVGKGGPYQLPGCGKDAFVTFEDYDTVVYQPGDPYPANASMAIRGQWLQEQYLHRLASLAADHPNVGISLMWEAGDLSPHLWGNCATTAQKMSAWHQHHFDYIKSISPDTLIGTGTHSQKADLFAFVDFYTTEEGASLWLEEWFAALPPQPVVYTGWTAFNAAKQNCAKNCTDWAFVRGVINDAWTEGVQMGSPFWEYKNGTAYEDNLDPHFVALRAVFDGFDSWEDEPGVELIEPTLPPP